MASNNLTVEQSYAFMNSLFNQATGRTSSLTSVDTKDFVTVGQAVLKTGFEQTLNAIGVVLDRTIFSVRPYRAKFRGMMVDEVRFGGITRKINYLDSTAEADAAYQTSNGQSVDPWVVKKPGVLQMNFYGSNSYQRHVTIYRDQLYTAFQSAEQFGEFIGGIITTMVNNIEVDRENECRAAIINMVTGKYVADYSNVKSVLREYFIETGVLLNTHNMYDDQNFVPFVKWLYAYINTLCDQMAEYGIKFHMNVTGKQISRHTPDNRLKAYLSSSIMNKVAANVMSSIFNPDRLKTIDFESVVYWQNINEPLDMIAKPTYLNASDGSLIESENAVTVKGLLGILFDEDAMGVVIKHDETAASPYNPRGRYYNMFYAYNHQYWNDFTENVIALYAVDQVIFGITRSSVYNDNIAVTVGATVTGQYIGACIGDTADRSAQSTVKLKGCKLVSVESEDTSIFTIESSEETSYDRTFVKISVKGVGAGTANVKTKFEYGGNVYTVYVPVVVTAANAGSRVDNENEVAEDQQETKTTRSKKA